MGNQTRTAPKPGQLDGIDEAELVTVAQSALEILPMLREVCQGDEGTLKRLIRALWWEVNHNPTTKNNLASS